MIRKYWCMKKMILPVLSEEIDWSVSSSVEDDEVKQSAVRTCRPGGGFGPEVRKTWEHVQSHFSHHSGFCGFVSVFVWVEVTRRCCCAPENGSSVAPSRDARRFWGRARVWLTVLSTHHCVALREGTCHRFPVLEEKKNKWLWTKCSKSFLKLFFNFIVPHQHFSFPSGH